MNATTLFRYNFRVLMFSNWWLLVFPIAATQLTVFWNILTQPFSPMLPAKSVELISPLLAAFLSAHLLAAEYRSRIGAILASKPISLGKLVLLRLLVVLALVWALAALSLGAYYSGMQPYDVVPPALAGMVSTLFLALFALTFATLFRNPLAGFGVAALYWALDLPAGPAIHPYLSLRSLSSNFSAAADPAGLEHTLAEHWWVGKIVLLVAAAALYLGHGRLLFTLGAPLTSRHRRRAVAWAAAALAVYLISGAAIKVVYGYTHRGQLFPDDAAWFRTQFAPFGPLPVAALFGPAFKGYLGEFTDAWRAQPEESERWGDTVKHRRDLHRIVEEMPRSLWAPGAAELLARLEARQQTTVEGQAAYYTRIVREYGDTPYVAFALREMARVYAAGNREAEARAAYEKLLADRPGSAYETEALRYLMESDRGRGDLSGAARWAERWIGSAPLQEKFSAYVALAEIRRAQGKSAESKRAAQQAIDAVRDFRGALARRTLTLSGAQRVKWEREAEKAEAKARQF